MAISRISLIGLRVMAVLLAVVALETVAGCSSESGTESKPEATNTATIATKEGVTMPPLNEEEKHIIIDKGTEAPFSGKYWDYFEPGVYLCRQCGAELYKSEDKFDSHCGWPSFDDEIPGAVKRQPDADGRRTEILCANCGGHLGHVFEGEQLTEKNVRHCVNSLSMAFRPAHKVETAIFAGGCFWGVEHQFEEIEGVEDAVSGYTGGHTKNPTYEQVCSGNTGHAEAVKVTFNPEEVSYEDLARRFFEIHDPTQVNRQGPDVGSQYRTAVFYTSEDQKKTTEKLIALLKKNGYKVVTEVVSATEFYEAEDYHQDYIQKHPSRPCGIPVPRFEKKSE